MRKTKKPAITSEWRENKVAQEKAQLEAGRVARQYAHEKVVTTVSRGAKSAATSAWALGSLLFAVLLSASLFTYTPTDPGFSATGNVQPTNICGVAGAWVADLAFWLFGRSAWWFVAVFFAMFVSSVLVATSRRENSGFWRKCGSLLALLVLLASSVALEAVQFSYVGGGYPMGAGGLCGQQIATRIVPLMGVWGATILELFLLALCSSVFFRFSWVALFEALGGVLEAAFHFFGLLRGAREPRREQSPLAGMQQAASIIRPTVPTHEPEKVHSMKVQQVAAVPPSAQAISSRQGNLFDEPKGCGRVLPEFKILMPPPAEREGISEETIGITSRLIESKLRTYRVEAKVVGAQAGPVITQYWLELSDGVKGSRVEDIRKDLTRALAVHSVRVVPVIPGKPYMGLEIPNSTQQRMTVYLSEIIGSAEYEKAKSLLSLALGKDIAGRPVVIDLARMPHLLVGGTTGSGKSVAVNTMILSLLYKCEPSQLRLVLIDPKTVEFSLYQGIPHLLCPVVTDMNKAANALSWLVQEMDRRYNLMSRLGVRSFDAYNEKVRVAEASGTPLMDPFDVTPENPEPSKPLHPFPYIVCFIDELADLILINRKQVEIYIMRLAQKARAAGMHMVLATQRPSVDIVTPLIKANIVARICFQVASRFDSQVVLDENGAQDLLGRGDMLLRKPGESLLRVQSCMVADHEVEQIADQLKSMAAPDYVDAVTEDQNEAEQGPVAGHVAHRSGEGDPLYDQAVQLVLETKRATTSFVQRRFNIGYNRAANLLESMEAAGVISKPNAAGKREILVQDGELFQ